MVGRVGVCARVRAWAPTPGLWMGDLPRDGDDQAEGEASMRHPLELASAEGKDSAIATNSMRLTLLDDARLLLDFEGVKGDCWPWEPILE